MVGHVLNEYIPSSILSSLHSFALLFGTLKIASLSIRLLSFFHRQWIRPLTQSSDRIYQLYGTKDAKAQTARSWAVITGGSDGIGLALCKHLAKQGFNICIVARNEEKIKEKLKEIKLESQWLGQVNNNFESMYVIADFSKLTSMEQYQNQIGEKIKGLDIGVVCLNAGFGNFGPFIDTYIKENDNVFQVNCGHVFYLSTIFAHQLIARKQKTGQNSAMVFTSSGLGARPISGMVTYSSSKAFVSHFAKGLAYELEGQVDVMSYDAGEVLTKLLQSKKSTDSRTITPERAASVCFRDVGTGTNATTGSFRHEFWMMFMHVIPIRWIQWIFLAMSRKVLKRRREQQAAQKKEQ